MENGVPFIKIENVSFSYEGDEEGELLPPVLKNVNLEIEKGTFVAVLGHNGSGKSTLAKLINLILTPTEGKIYIDGKDITDAPRSRIFVIETDEGKEVLLPDIKEFVKEIKLDKGVLITPIPGFFEEI